MAHAGQRTQSCPFISCLIQLPRSGDVSSSEEISHAVIGRSPPRLGCRLSEDAVSARSSVPFSQRTFQPAMRCNFGDDGKNCLKAQPAASAGALISHGLLWCCSVQEVGILESSCVAEVSRVFGIFGGSVSPRNSEIRGLWRHCGPWRRLSHNFIIVQLCWWKSYYVF